MLGLGLQIFRRVGVLGGNAFARIWNLVAVKWNNETKTWDD